MMVSLNKQMILKNRRLKVSPNGMVTLPASARKSLKMERQKGCKVTVAVKDRAVILSPTTETGGFRVSPKGQLELRGDAREILSSGTGRHYWLELDDVTSQVRLKPI